MNRQTCATHPEAAAAFRCDGCGQLLCAECAQQGHRLVFCRLCGERALPLDGRGEVAEAPRDIMDRRRATIARSASGYGLAEALGYAFRGAGGQVYLAFVATLTVLDFVATLLPLVGGCIVGIPWALILLILPAFLFRIANSTAQGNDELPDWPHPDVWDLFRAALLFAFVVFVCLLPMFLFLQVPGCGPIAILSGTSADLGICLLAMALGLLVAVAMWIPAFGAVSLYDTFLAALRIDLHLRALAVAPRELVVTVPLLALLLLGRVVMPTLLGFLPWIGAILGHAVVGYTLFTGAHLVGLYFRRHWSELEELYLG